MVYVDPALVEKAKSGLADVVSEMRNTFKRIEDISAVPGWQGPARKAFDDAKLAWNDDAQPRNEALDALGVQVGKGTNEYTSGEQESVADFNHIKL
ncbi:hypothetical protein AB0M45_21570 [Nocardia sp. NPDC051787]|uniref:WXG100 family type VII secretion target n=1 Tax=Nocardia sp. NPDC051787 TaxID=3155415 RepID=UPI00343814CF